MNDVRQTPLARQTRVLVDRYALCLLGDLKSVALLIGQAPLIGYFCALVWGDIETDTTTLRFVLCLSALWFGCINACREVVKERAILERERLFGLSMLAYLASKALVLGALGLVQVVLLLGVVQWHLDLRGPVVVHFLALLLCSSAGTTLGLLVSAFVRAEDRAVLAVPLLLLPQILFSEISIPREYFGDVVAFIERLMPVRWGFRAFEESAAKEPDWLFVFGQLSVLTGYALLLFALAVMLLLRRRR